MVTVYCDNMDCQFHDGVGCGADFMTVDVSGECTGPNVDTTD